jgi:D-glycero-beta-D-manno-heptose-7-phosphate kinase
MALKQSHDNISISAKTKSRLHSFISKFDSARLLVVGDFILDEFVWGEVSRISPEAPVPVVDVKRQSFMPGGALNVANNIRSLKGTVYPCGVVGRDLYGRMLLKMMRREKIETGGVIYDRARPTSLKTRVIAHSQQVVRFDKEKISDLKPLQAKEILEFAKDKIKDVRAIIIEDYGKGVVTPGLIRSLVRAAKSRKIPVLVDPKEKHIAYYKGVTAITPNRKEAYAAFGVSKEEPPALSEVGHGLIRKLQSKAVLITLGEEGMALFEKNGTVTKIPTAAREVFDVSGAGDTVIAVFGLALAVGATLKEAAILSNLAAGVVVGKLGTASLDQAELEAALKGRCS